MDDLEKNLNLEVQFWESRFDSFDLHDVENIIGKISDASVFLDCLQKHAPVFDNRKILELGAGQAWASCIVKQSFPQSRVIATDLSELALEAGRGWETIFGVEVDQRYACKSYQTEEGDASIDTIFTFAAAHHFLAHRRTLKEISRILKPGGMAFYFYEPACSRTVYPHAYRRVNRIRPEVHEDVLITSELVALANEAGLIPSIERYPSIANRRPFPLLYYAVLKQIGFLQNFLPCTTNFIFSKKEK